MRPLVLGVGGPDLLAGEAALFAVSPPAGVILFGRNVDTPARLARLIADLRGVLPPEAVLMLDQEGGRVARLRPPHWLGHPPAAAIGALHARDPAAGLRAAWLHGAAIGAECRAAGLDGPGFDVIAAPVLDLAFPGADAVVGDRAFAEAPEAVAALGAAVAAGLLAAGIQPVAKHAPGHGRARVDSHAALPEIGAPDMPDGLQADLLPFALNAGLPWLMTAHIRYTAWDAGRPATLSPFVLERIIRGRLGFQGVLITDDLAMGALQGSPVARALAALAAGADLALECAGKPDANAALLAALPVMGGGTAARLASARAMAAATAAAAGALDPAALAAERDRLLA